MPSLAIENPTFYSFFNAFLLLLSIWLFYKITERLYYRLFNKSLFIHFYIFKKKLSFEDQNYLDSNFKFYANLSKTKKSYFEHRLVNFIQKKEFIGRDDLEITNEMKLLVGATATMLTFGMKTYLIEVLQRIIIYPEAFYSTISEANHKGEFNPKLKAIVFSWKDFLEGYEIENDNLNLGIHEFTHAIHFNSLTNNSYSSKIFKRNFNALALFLSQNELLRKDLITSQYFRDYAFTNQFEFLAVLIENYIETPENFKSHFPNLYKKVKQLLNFSLI